MLIPVHLLIASPLRLAIAIALFIALDLSVLLINLWIADQVGRDAVAINLAGRQRMLSQQITKSLLLIEQATSSDERQSAHDELAQAFRLFETTLNAFDQGGYTNGGDNKQVALQRVTLDAGRKPLNVVLGIVKPISARFEKQSQMLMSGASDEAIQWMKDYMVAHNREILANMNQLTSALEQHSLRRIKELRTVQAGAFVLAMVNFLVIVLGLIKQYQHVAKAGFHWREAAHRDDLTGLYNRAALRNALDAGLAAAMQEGKTLALLMLDLDGFKPINDRYGHAAGDLALKAVAEALQHLARESDAVARLGGDEFALVCPNLHGQEHIAGFCDRLVARLAAVDPIRDSACGISASVGIAVFPAHGTSVDELLAAADRAMYQSKHMGGNRWWLAELNR